MGKENAKVGQGKAFKEGWIKKDKDTLRANVRFNLLNLWTFSLTYCIDRLDHRHKQGATPDHTKDSLTSRP